MLRDDGTLWLNMGDSYASQAGPQVENTVDKSGNFRNRGQASGKSRKAPMGLKPKDLCGIPWRVALALQADGWYLRSGIPWVKKSAMPESCSDRPASALEYVFLLTKSAKYYFDMEAIRVKHKDLNRPNGFKGKDGIGPRQNNQGWSGGKVSLDKHREYNPLGRNFRNTDLFFESLEPPFGAIFADDELVGLDINPKGFSEAHFATFPPRLPEVAILAGCPKGKVVLDPFGGAMTTAIVAHKYSRKFIMIELSRVYIDDIGIPRIEKETRQLKLFN